MSQRVIQVPSVISDSFLDKLMRWCVDQATASEVPVSDRMILRGLINHLETVRLMPKRYRREMLRKLEGTLTKIVHLVPPGCTTRQTASPGTPSSNRGGRKSQSPRGEVSEANGGEGMAVYQRVEGRGLSFEDSVSIRQQSRRQQRRLAGRLERALNSGSREDLEDVEW